MGGPAGFIFLAEGNSYWWLRPWGHQNCHVCDFALVKWNGLWEEKLWKMPRRGSHGVCFSGHKIPTPLGWRKPSPLPASARTAWDPSVSVCVCWRSDFPWSMSWFLSTAGAVAAWNTDDEIRSWMRERQEKFSSELSSSGFTFAAASLFSVSQVDTRSLPGLFQSLCSCANSRHHKHPFLVPGAAPQPLCKGLPSAFQIPAANMLCPALPLASY